MRRLGVFFFIGILGLAACLPAQAALRDTAPIEGKLVSQTTSIRPGEPFWVGLYLMPEPEWHTYWKDPGEAGLATEISWTLPDGFTASPIRWPRPEALEEAGIMSYVYKGNVLLPVLITPPADLEPGRSVRLAAKASWLGCKEICLPGGASLVLDLPVRTNAPQIAVASGPLFEEAFRTLDLPPVLPSALNLGWALAFAFAGGLILNLMPCVFPVLSLKILSFVHQSHDEPGRIRTHGLAFFAGVMISFWALAGALLALRAGGGALGWGFQLQSPGFVLFLAGLLFVVALNFLGVFEVGLGATGIGARWASSGGLAGSFASGILATILATPCTAPFMGAALGFALTQTAVRSFLIFTALGIGMAAPYVMLSFFPGLLAFLPKPGAWMERFKKIMSIPVLFTVAWLAWVFTRQSDGSVIAGLGLFLVLLWGSAFFWGKSGSSARNASSRKTAAVVAVILLAAAVATAGRLAASAGSAGSAGSAIGEGASASSAEAVWRPYSREAVEAALLLNRPVFIDFTADWCLTCQFNKLTTLHTNAANALFAKYGVERFKADWTNRDARITEALESYGRNGVPVYVWYPRGKTSEAELLPEILTSGILRKALEEAGVSDNASVS
ncbi:MAG: thioredoxin family protein [Candidatus Omnitrophica bacterium]|nr:thioredoxin family protein [Candidatus Omnitrophota bacterium]